MFNASEKGSVAFLLYSYFGITVEDETDEIICAAINKAYQDATNQGAFNVLFEKNNNTAKSKIEAGKNSATNDLKKYIVNTVMLNSLENNVEWHEKICNDVWKRFPEDLKENVKKPDAVELRGKRVFSYGNAQKWVNMTLKNLYIISAILLKYHSAELKHKKEWGTLYNNAKYFHIPIDNYILQEIFDSDKETKQSTKCFDDKSGNIIWIHKVDKAICKIKFADGKADEYTWSQIPNYEMYLKIQNVLLHLAGANPLDWENDKWIEIAKKRKKYEMNTSDSIQGSNSQYE